MFNLFAQNKAGKLTSRLTCVLSLIHEKESIHVEILCMDFKVHGRDQEVDVVSPWVCFLAPLSSQ